MQLHAQIKIANCYIKMDKTLFTIFNVDCYEFYPENNQFGNTYKDLLTYLDFIKFHGKKQMTINNEN